MNSTLPRVKIKCSCEPASYCDAGRDYCETVMMVSCVVDMIDGQLV
jgi:hypothetical protein